jgi:RNA polymerase sigma-70 factor (ECF subfamily)
MLKYRHTYRTDGTFKTWMFSIARNARKDFLREHRAEYDSIDESNDFPSGEPNPEERLVHEDDVRLVRRALDGLPEDKREILIMSRFQDMKYEEIGNVLGCSVGAVKVRVFRALRALTDSYNTLT